MDNIIYTDFYLLSVFYPTFLNKKSHVHANLFNKNFKSIANSYNLTDEEFQQWLVGFSDANFGINYRKEGTSNWISLYYRIQLHNDDVKVLELIHKRLGCGSVKTYVSKINKRSYSEFKISDSKDLINILIPIFDSFPLNTTKYLDFLLFKEALLIFLWKDHLNSVGRNRIIEITNSYNNSRIDFKQPQDKKIVITPYWLIGFIEGEGSFNFTATKGENWISANFSISQTDVELPVMEAIKTYIDNLGLNPVNHKVYIDRCGLYHIESLKDNVKGKYYIATSDLYFIYHNFIPFFNNYNAAFLTKKRLDFEDWKLGVELKVNGLHLKPLGRELLLYIADNMNNRRLSTNKEIHEYSNNLLNFISTLNESGGISITNILKNLGPSLYKLGKNGEFINKNTNKTITKAKYYYAVNLENHQGGELALPSGDLNKQININNEIKIFKNVEEIAVFFEKSVNTVYLYIKNEKPFLHKSTANKYYIKKIF